ncbi:MAG: hypothetical protein J3K34DRAFT_382622 [Monoraphidium minutum]|nr:MAG: hypothetical protein J3K34DRAFT_382622 [Monoraphidium minutum]
MGPRAVCALITQLGRAKQCDKVRRRARAPTALPPARRGPPSTGALDDQAPVAAAPAHHPPTPATPAPPAPCPQAVAVFDACPRLGIAPNSHIYSALVSACSAAGRWADALGYFEAARTAGAANEITYSAAIAVCMRSNELDRGLRLLSDMRGAALEPDGITYCTLLLAAQRCARAPGARAGRAAGRWKAGGRPRARAPRRPPRPPAAPRARRRRAAAAPNATAHAVGRSRAGGPIAGRPPAPPPPAH